MSDLGSDDGVSHLDSDVQMGDVGTAADDAGDMTNPFDDSPDAPNSPPPDYEGLYGHEENASIEEEADASEEPLDVRLARDYALIAADVAEGAARLLLAGEPEQNEEEAQEDEADQTMRDPEPSVEPETSTSAAAAAPTPAAQVDDIAIDPALQAEDAQTAAAAQAQKGASAAGGAQGAASQSAETSAQAEQVAAEALKSLGTAGVQAPVKKAKKPRGPNYSSINADISVANVSITQWQDIYDDSRGGAVAAARFPLGSGAARQHIEIDLELAEQVQKLLCETTAGDDDGKCPIVPGFSHVHIEGPLRERAKRWATEHMALAERLAVERSVAGSKPSWELVTRSRLLVAEVAAGRAQLELIWAQAKALVEAAMAERAKRLEQERQTRRELAESFKKREAERMQERKDKLREQMLSRISERIENLPAEILMLIWTHSPMPMKFQLVCKRWYQLSKTPTWRAEYLTSRFAPYEVMFHAIARPKIFTPELFERLVQRNIPVPRYLVQELFSNKAGQANFRDDSAAAAAQWEDPTWFGPSVPSTEKNWKPSGRWGAGITMGALGTVLTYAGKKYGDKLDLASRESDTTIHGQWYRVARSGHRHTGYTMTGPPIVRESVRDMVVKLYTEHDFVPYFTDIATDERAAQQTALSETLAAVICNIPAVAPFLSRQGWRQREATKLAMFSWLLKNKRENLLALLDLNLPEWKLPPTFAARVLFGMLPRRDRAWNEMPATVIFPETRFAEFKAGARVVKRDPEWDLLLELNTAGRLDFDLTTLAGKFFRFSDAFGCNWSRFLFVRQLVEDLPEVDVGSGKTLLEAVFFALETGEISDLEKAHSILSSHMTVKADDLVHILLCNWTRRAFALSYGELYCQDFDETEVISKALPGLMEQPYKGKLLETIFSYFSAPEREVELRNIFIAALNTKVLNDVWRIEEDRQDWSTKAKVDWSDKDNTRTAIGQSFSAQRSAFKVKLYDAPYGPTGVPGFFPFHEVTEEEREKYEHDKERRRIIVDKTKTSAAKAAATKKLLKGKGKGKAVKDEDDEDDFGDDGVMSRGDASMTPAEKAADGDGAAAGAEGEGEVLEPIFNEAGARDFSKELENEEATASAENVAVDLLLNYDGTKTPLAVLKEKLPDTMHRWANPFDSSGSIYAANDLEILIACRRQNVFGPRWTDGGDFWNLACEKFGENADFAQIIFSHAMLNNNQHLGKKCLKAGATITADHFRLLMRTSREPPSWMIQHLVEEAPGYMDSNASMVYNSIDPVPPIKAPEHPWYKPGIVTAWRENKPDDAGAQEPARRSSAEAASASPPPAESSAAAAKKAKRAAKKGKKGAADESIAGDADAASAADGEHGGEDEDPDLDNSEQYFDSMDEIDDEDMDEDGDPWFDDEDDVEDGMEDYSLMFGDHIRAIQARHQDEMRERAEMVRDGPAPETPDFATLIGNKVKTLDEAEADRRALATWEWQHAFDKLNKEVSEEYTFKRALAKEQHVEGEKLQRTHHSEFKKWCQKFSETYKVEHNHFRKSLMTQKRLIMNDDIDVDLTGEIERDRMSSAAAVLELPGLLEEIQKSEKGKYDAPRNIVEASYYKNRPDHHSSYYGHRHPKHRTHWNKVKRLAADDAARKLQRLLLHGDDDGLPEMILDDLKDGTYKPRKSKHGDGNQPPKKRRWTPKTKRLHPTEGGVSQPCSECEYPDTDGEY